jgi:prepilin-type N-terminal cleavage/methylation domain-containing protein
MVFKKQKMENISRFIRARGFTVIELLVVISIMGIFATLVLVNYNSLRAERNKKLARHELATAIRKVQSYTLSGRLTAAGTSARYYLVKLTPGQSTFLIQSISSTASQGTPPVTVETIKYPGNITLAELYYYDSSNGVIPTDCAQIVFAAPYAKTYIDYGCVFENDMNDPSVLLSKQDNKLDILFDTQNTVDSSIALPAVEVNGVVGSVSEVLYLPTSSDVEIGGGGGEGCGRC